MDRNRQRPRSAEVAARASDHLRGEGRIDEAEAAVETALSRFGEHPALLTTRAFNADWRGLHEQSAEQWRRIRDLDPNNPTAWCGMAASARVRSRLDEAGALAEEALARFPDDPDVLTEAARVADRRADRSKALAIWTRLRAAPSVRAEWLQGYIAGLIHERRFDEAETDLAAACHRFPNDRSLVATRGALLMAREEWDAALVFWEDYRATYPDDQAGWVCHGQALFARENARLGEDSLPLAPVAVARVEDEATRALLLRFESLGEDCEFGMVQRRFGAEPLSLLRWSSVSPEALTMALAARFEGMGAPETTDMPVLTEEYQVGDVRWGLLMHTFTLSTHVDRDLFFARMCKRLTYLRDKLLDDLRCADKIFVYKGMSASLDAMRDLHGLIREIGPATLLWVKLSNDVGPNGRPGEIQRLEDGLYVGFIGRSGSANGFWDIAFDDWVSICRAARGAGAVGERPMATRPIGS